MSLLAGKLQLGIETLEDILRFLRELEARGVSIATIKEVTKDPVRLDAIVEAFESQETAREERLTQLATLADELPEDRVAPLLQAAFPHRPNVVRMFSKRAGFESLLKRVTRLRSWQPAAIVMYYGLGPQGKVYTIEQIVAETERAQRTVELFLTHRHHRQDGGSAVRRLADVWFYADRPRDFAPLSLSDDLRRALASAMDVRSLTELRFCTLGELQMGLSDDRLFGELRAELERHRIPLWQ